MSHDNGIDYSNMSMMEMFQEETRRLSADMSTDLLALEQDPENADLLESLMRESHTVKGAARMVGLESIVLLSHTIENIFVAAQEKKLTLDKESIDTLLKGIDIVSALAEMQCDDIESWIADHPDDIQESVNDCASLNDRAPLNSREDLPSTDDATDDIPVTPTVGSDDSGQQSAPERDDSVMELFRMEAETQCASLSDDLLLLEQDLNNTELLESLMRAAHSIKGAARVVDLDDASRVSHAMEDVFTAAMDGRISLTKSHVDHLLKGVDMIENMARIFGDGLEEWLKSNQDALNTYVTVLHELSLDMKEAEKGPSATRQDQPPIPSPSRPSTGIALKDMSMMELFRMEAENHCATLSDDLLNLEQDPGNSKILESLMRAAHSIKGAARVVDLNAAVQLAHAMEDVFVSAQNGAVLLNTDCIDILLNGLDMLSTIASLSEDELMNWSDEQTRDINTLIDRIKSILEEGELLQPSAPVTRGNKSSIATLAPSKPPPSSLPAQRKIEQKKQDAGRPLDRAIRVSAEAMNRLMGLTGEVQVESRWLPSFLLNVLRLKFKQDELSRLLENSREKFESNVQEEVQKALFYDLKNKINTCRNLLADCLTEVEDHTRKSTEISHRLSQEVIANRMRPFSEGIRGFPRMVRDLSRELGKEIRLDIIGPDTLVDRDILDKIEAPLNHLIRNAIDHGIESPDERMKAGKPKEAVIRLEARHRSGMLNVIVADDGRGIDTEKLRETVVDKGLTSVELAGELSDAELIDFLFLPNFSTRQDVSTISGRGVGLDVVLNVIQEVRGVVRSSTKMNVGTTFELQLPLTLSVLRALLVEIDNEPYAFPLVAINHVLRVPHEQIKELEGHQYILFEDNRIGLICARQLLERGKPIQAFSDEMYVVVVSDRMKHYGLIVDRFLDIRDLVVQSLDSRLGKVRDISSTAVLEDGSPILIIDIEDMIKSMDSLISGENLSRIQEIEGKQEIGKQKRILVVDDSITVREVERKMLEAKGYDVHVAEDGMDAWDKILANSYALVVTDIDMPRMNGFELVTNIKDDPRYNFLPVIIVSYKDREEDRNRGLESGADYYLTKGSFDDETFVEAVKNLIGGPETIPETINE